MLIALEWKVYRESLCELVAITAISISPLLFGAMIRWVQVENNELSLGAYFRALDSFLTRGELFLYALAFIAIVAWAALKDWPLGLRPPRVILGLFCFFSFGIITIFYSLDTIKVALHVDAVLILSKIMFFITLCFYYFATVLSKVEPPDFLAVLAQSSNALSAQLRRGTHP
jgi:hypothetical protein